MYSIYYFIKVGGIIDTINMINYSIMLVFFVCYAYQFLYIPIFFSFKQSVTQRLRWSKGYLQVLGKYSNRLFKCTLKGKFSAFDMLMNITPANVLSWVSIIVNILAIVVSIIKSDSVSTILSSLGQSALNLYLTMFFSSNIKKILYTFTFLIFMITYIPISVIAPFTKSEWKPINHNKSLILNDLKSFRKDVELN